MAQEHKGTPVCPGAGTGSAGGFLLCERRWVYGLLMTVAGFFGAYTYLLRGGVFCNAQTGNVVLMGLALGSGEWSLALYYLIPIGAYIAGAFFSELLPNPVKRRLGIRWDTLLIGVEMLVVLILGFVPESAPVQISQVAINLIASMQYNTFRQAEGMPMATTFVTNHVRQVGVGLAKELIHLHAPDKPHRKRLGLHSSMLLLFTAGAVVGAVLCHLFLGRALWLTLLPLGFLFIALLRADLTTERSLVDRKPSGH